jgi:hypothetical protein
MEVAAGKFIGTASNRCEIYQRLPKTQPSITADKIPFYIWPCPAASGITMKGNTIVDFAVCPPMASVYWK